MILKAIPYNNIFDLAFDPETWWIKSWFLHSKSTNGGRRVQTKQCWQGPFLREMPLQLLGVIQIFMSCGPRALEDCALAARVKSHTRNPGRE